MRETTKAANTAGFNGALAATMLLAFCCAPVLAASGIDCDRATARPDSLRISETHLNIAVADHGVTSATVVDAQNNQQDAHSHSAAGTSVTSAIAPRADTILRRIFDESYSSEELDELEPASATDAKSIAELALPSTSGNSATNSSDGEVPSLDADLPGISEDETLRFRRQMFRTDI